MVSRFTEVVNPSGLHLKPAGVLCQTSMKFDSSINIYYKDRIVNAKSVLNIMASGINCGSEIEVRCSGPDEEEALEAVCEAIGSGLGETGITPDRD